MEDKFLEIFHAKEKVIIKLNTSIESLRNNLGMVEDSLVNLASSKDTYSLVETHFNLKIESILSLKFRIRQTRKIKNESVRDRYRRT